MGGVIFLSYGNRKTVPTKGREKVSSGHFLGRGRFPRHPDASCKDVGGSQLALINGAFLVRTAQMGGVIFGRTGIERKFLGKHSNFSLSPPTIDCATNSNL